MTSKQIRMIELHKKKKSLEVKLFKFLYRIFYLVI